MCACHEANCINNISKKKANLNAYDRNFFFWYISYRQAPGKVVMVGIEWSFKFPLYNNYIALFTLQVLLSTRNLDRNHLACTWTFSFCTPKQNKKEHWSLLAFMETFVDKENLDGDITFKCSLLGNYPSWTKPKLARISVKLWKSIVNKQFWSMFSCDWVQLKAFFFFFFLLKLVVWFFCLFFHKLNFPFCFLWPLSLFLMSVSLFKTLEGSVVCMYFWSWTTIT